MSVEHPENTPVSFKLDKTEWKAGVAQIVLFDTAGQIIADRLIFMRKPEPLTISVRKNKEDYQPFDRVLLDFSVRDTAGKPVSAPISVSVRDGWEEVESRHSMLADLLLMSEIKGYVHRPLIISKRMIKSTEQLWITCCWCRDGGVMHGNTSRGWNRLN